MGLNLESLSKYPYASGVSGLNFRTLADNARINHYTESGRPLQGVRITDSHVILKDMLFPILRMYGHHYYPSNAISFSVQVRRKHGEWRHPDFDIDAFMSTVLNHFIENGKVVERFYCTWMPASVNYQRFEELLRNRCEIEEALWGTWTGQKAWKLGFRKIEEEPVSILNNPAFYAVTFAK